MAYHESTKTKALKLIKNPSENWRKILPFLKSKIEPHRRDLYEFFRNQRLSRPYPGHDDLLKYLDMHNGFFVECGGNDGYFQDPTYYLEKFKGWHGIIVEPLAIGKLCARNRNKSKIYFHALISKEDSRKTVDFIDCNAMSFIAGSIDNEQEWIKGGQDSQKIKARKIIVPARTIQSIIDEHISNKLDFKKIDLLVVDVEGSELEVLKGLDFNKTPPIHILVEAHTVERTNSINEFLSTVGYKYVTGLGNKDHLFSKK